MRAVLRALVVGGFWMVAGCTVTEGSTDLLRPERDAEAPPAPVVTPAAETAAPAAEVEPGKSPAFDLDGYKAEQAQADEEAARKANLEALRVELGVTGAVEEAPPPAAPPPAPPGPAPWTPATPIRVGWGLRLVSTVDAASPPRAILGLPDGREEVVKAGDLLPDVGVVVLAVGQGVVQVGVVSPEGDHARVESVFLQAMFGGQAAPAAAAVAPR